MNGQLGYGAGGRSGQAAGGNDIQTGTWSLNDQSQTLKWEERVQWLGGEGPKTIQLVWTGEGLRGNQKWQERGFPDGSVVKDPPASAGDMGRSLIQEDPTCDRATRPMQHNC